MLDIVSATVLQNAFPTVPHTPQKSLYDFYIYTAANYVYF